MRKRKTTQYPWGTERPLSKLEKIKARRRPVDRELELIAARSKRDRALRLQQDWVDMHQALHIEAATLYGSYCSNAATDKFPWIEECDDEELNQWLVKIEAEISVIATRKTQAEIEFDKDQAGVAAVCNRLRHLAAHLGRTDSEIERKITELVPGGVLTVFEMLDVQPNSEEVYFAFYGLKDNIHLPDGTLGHPDFAGGWPNALQPPADIHTAFPAYHIPTVSPEMMSEDAAWLWVQPLVFDGNGQMPPPWRQRALQPYGGSAVAALVALLKEDAALKGRYLAEQARQFMWPFFVDRRERLRFYLRLNLMRCIEFDEIQQAMADFDERESPLPAAASELNIADHKPLTPVFDSIFKLLPWPDGLGPSS